MVTIVQKVSNLILNINVSVLEASQAATPRAAYSVDIRGNNDEGAARHPLAAAQPAAADAGGGPLTGGPHGPKVCIDPPAAPAASRGYFCVSR